MRQPIAQNLVVTCITLFIGCSAWADPMISTEPVEIKAHYDNAIGSSDAASAGVVNAALIRNRPSLRTGEILEFIPGMIVSQHSGDGKANQYYLRGFNLDHGTDFATYVDEMPINMRSHAHGQGYTDLNFLIPELVNHIHYKKGPYFAEEGDFASAGAAHIQLTNRLPRGIASLSLGENGYQRVVLANSGGFAQGTMLYGLEVHRNDGPWDTPEQVRKYSGMLRYSEGEPNNSTNLTLMAYQNNWDSTDQVPLRAVNTGLINRFGNMDPTDGGKTSRYSFTYAKHTQNDSGALDMNAYVVRSSLDLFSNFTYFLNNPTDGDQFNQSERRNMVGFNISKTWFNNLAGIDTQTKLGMQSRYDDLAPLSLYNTVARQRTSAIRTDNVKEASVGLYIENTTQWLEKFRTVAGLRYDAYHFRVQSSLEGDSGEASDTIASPKLSFIFGPWAKTELFLNYGQGFHSNDARGTTETRLPNGGFTQPVTPLVKTRGSEVGMRSELINGLQTSLAVWQLDIASELVFVGDAGETEASRASRRYGIEWNNHYVANQHFMLDADLAASKARYTESDVVGNYIPGAVDKVASLGATLINLGHWSGGIQLRYFGPRPLIEDNSVRSKSTSIAYARIGYKLDQRSRINLDVFNLFDQKVSDIDYYYTSRLKNEASSVDDIHFHPAEPRSLRCTYIYEF